MDDTGCLLDLIQCEIKLANVSLCISYCMRFLDSNFYYKSESAFCFPSCPSLILVLWVALPQDCIHGSTSLTLAGLLHLRLNEGAPSIAFRVKTMQEKTFPLSYQCPEWPLRARAKLSLVAAVSK